jgi:hypothetical protein
MSTQLERLSLSRVDTDARLRASLARLNAVARVRLAREREKVSRRGHELIDGLVGAELFVLVAFSFGIGILLGRRR